MAGRLELHADFDRDGLLTGSSDERAADKRYCVLHCAT